MIFNNEIIILQSSTGTGKTTAVSNHIKRCFEEQPEIKLLCITPIKSLASQLHLNFNNVNCCFYQNETGDNKEKSELFEARALTICINSIIPFKYMKIKELNKYILYIDEINSFLHNLTHATTLDTNIKEVYEALLNILKHCKKIILSDANIKNNVGDLINNIKQDKKILFVKNHFQKYKNIKAYHINDANNFLNLMLERVKNNNYFLCGGDNRKEIHKIYNECKKVATEEQIKYFILITSEEDFILYNANEQFKNKFVFYSPKIIYGVDFNNFEAQDVFIYIKGMTISPSESFQQVCRTRNIKNLYFHGNDKNKVVQFKTLEQTKKHFKESLNLSKKLNIISTYFNEKDDKQIIENTFFNLFIRNEFIKSVYKSNKVKHFKNILSSFGFEVIESNQHYQTFNKILKNTMDNDLITETDEKFERFINDTDKTKPEYFNINKRAELLKLSNIEDMIKYKDYLINNTLLNNHYKIINYLKSDIERTKQFNKKTENIYECKIIGTTEQKLKIINQIERDYNINIKNGIINNNSNEVKFNKDFYKLIVNVFQTKKKQPKKMNEVVILYISMLRHTYLNLIESKQLRTKENRNKYEYKLNYLRLYEDLKLYQIRNPTLNKLDNVEALINQINEAIEPLKKHDKININQNIETIQNKEVEFIDEDIFINPKTDLDIFYDDNKNVFYW